MSAEGGESNVFTTGYNDASRDRYAARTAESCADYLLPYLKDLPPNFTFLDVGCGPGSITTDFAQRFPEANFTGVEPGEPFLEKAKALAQERGTTNVTFKKGDVMKLSDAVELGSFDVVHCHQVLIHLPEPLNALKNMKSAAKSQGGLVAACEGFASGVTVFPTSPELQEWHERQFRIMTENGSDTMTGAKLISYALDAGWSREQVKASAGVWCYSEPAEKIMWGDSMVSALRDTESDWYQRSLSVGATPEKMEACAKAWEVWKQADDAWSTFVSGNIVCRNAEGLKDD